MNRSVINLAVATVLSTMTISGTALAEGNYGSLNLGLSSIDGFSDNSTLDTGVGGIPLESAFDFSNSKSISGALGRRMSPNLRMEIELNYRKADMSSKLTSLSFGGVKEVVPVAPVEVGDTIVFAVPAVDQELYTAEEIAGLQAGASLQEDGTAFTQDAIDGLVADDSVRITGVTGVTEEFYTAADIAELQAGASLQEDGTAFTQDAIDGLIADTTVRITGVTGITEELYTAVEIAGLQASASLKEDGSAFTQAEITALIADDSVRITGVPKVDAVFYTQDEVDFLQSDIHLNEDGIALTQAEIAGLVFGPEGSVKEAARAEVPAVPYTDDELVDLLDDDLDANGDAYADYTPVIAGAAAVAGITGAAAYRSDVAADELLNIKVNIIAQFNGLNYNEDEVAFLQSGANLKEDGTAYTEAEIANMVGADPLAGTPVIGSVKITAKKAITEELYTQADIDGLQSSASLKEDGTAFSQDEITALEAGVSPRITGVTGVTEEFYTQADIDGLQAGASLKENGEAFTQVEIDALKADTSVRITGVAGITEELYTQADIDALQVGASLKEDGTPYTQEEIDALKADESVRITGVLGVDEVVAGEDDVVDGVEGVEGVNPELFTASERTIGDIESTTALVNVYYDFNSESKFTPYMSIGAGIGWHKATVSDYTITSDMRTPDNLLDDEETYMAGARAKDHAFAYQLGFGGSYEVAESTYLTAGYRHIGSAAVDFDGIAADISVHEINAGIRMEF